MSESRSSRSPARVLQYLDQVREGYRVGRSLGLLPECTDGAATTSAPHLHLLRRHHLRRVATRDAIRQLAGDATVDEVVRELERSLCRPKVDFHPVQGCNFGCGHCSWRGREVDSAPRAGRFPVDAMANLRFLEPRGVVLSGGYCEPTLFRHPDCDDLSAFVRRIRQTSPSAQLGLNTNGSLDAGPCVPLMDWLRINLDAGSEPSFLRLKRPRTDCSLESVLDMGRRYLERSDGHQHLGTLAIGFLYMDDNIVEVPRLVRLVHEKYSDSKRFEALSIQFRPLRPPIPDRANTEAAGSFESGCDRDQLSELHREMSGILRSHDRGFRRFVISQTNYVEMFTRYRAGSASFGYRTYPNCCPIPLLSVLVGPDGSLYPCLEAREIASFDPSAQMVIGNLKDLGSRTGRLAFALNTYYAMNMIHAYCNRTDCSQGEVILPLDRAIGSPSACSLPSESPFF